MRTGIYAILDVTADMIIGGLHLHKAEAAAIRMFSDIAALPDTTIGKHPEDFELLFLGAIGEDNQIDLLCPPVAVLTGKQWAAMNGPDVGQRHESGTATPLRAS